MARLFFALWPDERAREALARLAVDVGTVAQGKPVPAAKIHLTLSFLGEVAEERRDALRAAARAVRGTPLELVLDRLGSFRKARAAWAAASEVPAALTQLQSALEARLRERGFALEERPYRPHVTLARSIRAPLPAASIEPITMRCEALALVRTEPGSGAYASLESWGLG
jgi:RNA 2',3'-cyclic 3'-phosphodiesterase